MSSRYLPSVIRCLPEIWKNVTLDEQYVADPLYRYTSFEEKTQVEALQIARAQARGIDPPLHFPVDSLQSFGVCTLQMTGVIQGKSGAESIPLTSINFAIPHFQFVGSQIAHTQPEQHARIRQHLDHLLQEAIQEPGNDKFKEKALRMVWWSAHACLDLRGSAAKTEMLYRSMLASRNIDCPLWKPGVSADLEAMIRTESQWLDAVKHLEWPSQELGDAIGAPPLRLHPVQQNLLGQQG